MKKIICFFLALFLLLTSAFPAFADIEPEEQGLEYLVPIRYSDHFDDPEELHVLIKEDQVYVNAKKLALRLGFQYRQNEKGIFIYNLYGSSSYNDTLPQNYTWFHANDTQVSYYLFNNLFDLYFAPFANFVDEEGTAWIPLAYSALLLNTSLLFLDDAFYMEMPQKNILDSFLETQANSSRYTFEWNKDFGYSEKDAGILTSSSHVVNLFNSILDGEEEAWQEAFTFIPGLESGFDRKYGKELAQLLCTTSKGETKALSYEFKKISNLFAEEGFIDTLLNSDETLQIYSSADEKAIAACSSFLDKLSNGGSLTSEGNKLSQALAQSKKIVETTNALRTIQSYAAKGATVLQTFALTVQFGEYTNEFETMDAFNQTVLKDYLDHAEKTPHLSDEMRKEFANFLDLLSTNPGVYSTVKLFDESLGNFITSSFEITKLDSLFLSLAWDILSEHFPLVSDGLDSADQFELALYAILLQEDTYYNQRTSRDAYFANLKEPMPADLYELARYHYLFLKSCYITREAALGSLSLKSHLMGEEMLPLINSQQRTNNEIAAHLLMLKNANETNDSFVYGFLPIDNREYLDTFDDAPVKTFIEEHGKLLGLEKIYIRFLNEGGHYDYVGDCHYGAPYQYAMADINGDKWDELLVHCGDMGFFDFLVFGYDKTLGEIYCITYPEGESDFQQSIYGDDYEGYINQYYGSLVYSKKYQALVYNETRTGAYYGGQTFWNIQDKQFISSFSAVYELNYETKQRKYYHVAAGVRTEITEEEYRNYLEDSLPIAFKDIPLLTN